MFPPFSFSLFAVITCTGLGLLAHASLGTWWLFFLGWNPKSGISRTEHAYGCLKLCPMLLKCLLKAMVVLMSPPGPTHVQSPGLGEALLLQGPGRHPLCPALASGALSFFPLHSLVSCFTQTHCAEDSELFSLSVWGLEDKITKPVGCLPCSLL